MRTPFQSFAPAIALVLALWPSTSSIAGTLRAASGEAWSAPTQAGDIPAIRNLHSMVYDSNSGRVILYGGRDLLASIWSDAFELAPGDNPTWTRINASGTARPLFGHVAVFDPVGNRMIVFGGIGNPGISGELWSLSLGAEPKWTQLVAGGTPPGARVNATAVYDPAGRRMIVYGGTVSGQILGDAYQLSLGASPTWSLLTPTGSAPPPRMVHSAILDPVANRMIIFGGFNNGGMLADVWQLSLGDAPGWTQLSPTGTAPGARSGQSAVYDASNQRMVVYGGSGFQGETWELSLIGSPKWTQLTPSGASPTPREWHSAACDPSRARMVVFGGYTQQSGGSVNDLWYLDLGLHHACAPAPANLVGWWKLEGDVHDVTGQHSGGVAGGGGFYDAGKVGQGFHPDPTTLIAIPHSFELDPTRFTIDAWVRLDSLPAGAPCIIWKGDASGIAYTSPYELAIYGSSLPAGLAGRALAVAGGPAGFDEVDSDTPVPIGTWVHLAATADGDSLKLYQDGVLVGSRAQTVTPIQSSYPLQLGGILGAGEPNSFTGSIDEVEIHASAASARQIQAIYLAGAAGKCLPSTPCAQVPADLISWWKLDGNAQDLTGANPGYAAGATSSFEPAYVGQGIHMSSPGDGIIVPASPSMDVTNMTVDAWVRLDQFGYQNSLVAWKGEDGLDFTTPFGLGINGTSAGNGTGAPWFLITNGILQQDYVESPVAIDLHSWVHLAGTADGSTVKIYVDGELAASIPQTVAPFTNTTLLSIGGIHQAQSNALYGTIDEVELHGSAASAGQIRAIFEAGSAGKCQSAAGVHGSPRTDALSLSVATNPSRGEVGLAFRIPRPSATWLQVFDVTGRRVRTLLAGRLMSGEQHLSWDGHGGSGERVSGGVYFAQLRAGGSVRTARIVVVRP